MTRIAVVLFHFVIGSAVILSAQAAGDPIGPGEPVRPTNIILFIGDGMGAAQIEAASHYATGEAEGLGFQRFPIRTDVATGNVYSRVTDSAAAATAMATGTKVANGAISVARPGSGEELTTIFELARDAGLATGFVTTASVTHATVAAFAAHEPRREWYNRIADDYLEQTRPNVIFGGAGRGVSVESFGDAGYEVATDTRSLLGLASTKGNGQHFAALLGDGHLPYVADGRGGLPGLPELTAVAVGLLQDDPDGFLLVVEAARIDHAGHDNDLTRLVPELLELEQTVDLVLSFPETADSTLVIVTSDHETGGLFGVIGRGVGRLPEASWSTGGHTGVDVPLYATGPGADEFASVRDNTEIFERMREALGL